ncbi:MAG TPA: hypothetical protein VF115_02170, partial [Acidimicrobiia bacterium]
IGIGIVVGLGYLRLLRPWHLRWGATAAEVQGFMPGDDLISEPSMSATRAITIEAPPEAVWPWLVQMGGYIRAGWYSYDRFDNAGVPSADRIVPELQDLQVGDIMLTSPTEGFVVRSIDPQRSLVLDLKHRGSRITSVLMLSPMPNHRGRLVTRVRAYFRPRHRLFAIAFDLGDFLFMRRQMLGIKKRAERTVPFP